GTPHPRSYLEPLFAALAKSLGRLLTRLESEGVPPPRVLDEARALWEESLRQAQEGPGESPEAEEPQPPARSVAQALERLTPPGQEVPVRDLRREAGEGTGRRDFDQALLQLAREGRVELRPFTPPPGGGQPPAEEVVTDPEGRTFDRVVR